MNLSKNAMILFVIGDLILFGGAFVLGAKLQPAFITGKSAQTFDRAALGQGGAGGFARGGGGAAGRTGGMRFGNGGGVTAGEIQSMDATGLTLKLRDGSSKIVLTTSSTKVMKMTDVNATELKQGTTVTVLGKANSDGSVTAESVQIRPALPPAPATPVTP